MTLMAEQVEAVFNPHNHTCNWCGEVHPHTVPASECEIIEPWYCSEECSNRSKRAEKKSAAD